MNRIPFPVKAQVPAATEAAAKPEFEPYYQAEAVPQPQSATAEVQLTALELMYAYYDAA